MAWIHPAAEEYQRQRWTRPDGERYLRPDAERWLSPEELHLLQLQQPADAKSQLQPFDRKAWFDRLRGGARHAFGNARRAIEPMEDDPGVRRLIAELKLDLRRLQLWLKAYNPNQPRVPRGVPEGGEWTRLAGPSPSGRGTGGIGANFPGATFGQLTRFRQAVVRTERALEGIRSYDPHWRPSVTSATQPGSIEGAIRHAEARAAQAEARLDRLRTGIGGNLGPPLDPPRFGTSSPSSRSFDGQAWIDLYRAVHNMPDLFGNPSWPNDKGTVAVARVDGDLYFGVNSTAPGYRTEIDGEAAYRRLAALITSYPDVMATDNIGRVPNDSLYHAESTILIRIANAHGGTLAGRTISIQTDRELCSTSCPRVLPLLGLELGNPTVVFIDRSGSTRVMRNGGWER